MQGCSSKSKGMPGNPAVREHITHGHLGGPGPWGKVREVNAWTKLSRGYYDTWAWHQSSHVVRPMFPALASVGLPMLSCVPHALLMGTNCTSLSCGAGPAVRPHQSDMPSQSEECQDEHRAPPTKPTSDLPCACTSAHSHQ